jgi:selenocysteine lyase/cysteine desulfurase
MPTLEDFKAQLDRSDIHSWITGGLIGNDVMIDGPFGPKPLIYADYVASGRCLAQVEDFVRDSVMPYYANSHTQASFCGEHSTKLREAARAEIARMTGVGDTASVIFTGAGSTAGINCIVGLLDIATLVASGRRAVVMVGPYEHHSNLLPWRESGAEVVEIPEGVGGGPDKEMLEKTLKSADGASLIVGAFSAASNVTGILTNVDEITRQMKRHNALVVWDYGCGGPYIEMNMQCGTDCAKDAIVFSTHKFPGGPGASGITIVRHGISRVSRPTQPGGGTVEYVSPWGHTYSKCLVAREESGTPNLIGDIRAALAMLIKEALGQAWLTQRQDELRQRALAVWQKNPRLDILGRSDAPALPIFSFRVRNLTGDLVHHQFFTRLLSDLYGVQARGGCACAGSYAHRLLGLGRAESDALYDAIFRGNEVEKPGWVRLNFSALMTNEKADVIINAVDSLAYVAPDYLKHYQVDATTAQFNPSNPKMETAQA